MSSFQIISRRTVLAGLGGALVAPGLAVAASRGGRWLAYEASLQSLATRAVRTDRIVGLERGLLDATNAFRRSNRLPALLPHAGLARVARAHAADMARRDFFDHVTPDLFSSSERVGLMVRDFAGLTAENITMGEDLPRTVTAVDWFKYWRDSPDHRKNLLRPDFTHAGHGMVKVGRREYGVGLYVWQAATLPAPPPLRLTDGEVLVEAMAGAMPHIDRFQISDPGGEDDGTSRAYRVEDAPPELAPGAWRLRPFLPLNRGSYPVVWGPIFVVG